MTDQIIQKTRSVCPVCLNRLPAVYRQKEDGIYLEKSCAEHGDFSSLVWEGTKEAFLTWCDREHTAAKPLPAVPFKEGCPYDCGLCPSHEQKGCCLLLEVTQRCNLTCPVCFAAAGEEATPDPSLAEISGWFDDLMALGGPFNIQLSGGEPTMRDDLEAIIRLGRDKGFTFFQLNTNGIRIAEDAAYLHGLADAGLNTVFLQFDGFRSETHRRLRGRDLHDFKHKAIEHCAQAGVGVVLVPVVDDENLDEIGDIINFALKNLPAVRGVHFQPLSRFGRYPDDTAPKRITIPRLLQAIEMQTEGRIKALDFSAPNAEHPLCSIHGDFLLHEDDRVQALQMASSCCDDADACCASERARTAVAKQWSFPEDVPEVEAPDAFDTFLSRIQTYRLAVSAMFFQDAWTVDLNRLKRCYILEWQDARHSLVPFCAYNLTAENGEALYRGRTENAHGQ